MGAVFNPKTGAYEKTSFVPTADQIVGKNLPNQTQIAKPDPYAGMPAYPDITNLLDPNGNLKSNYALAAQGDVGFTSNINDLQNRLNGIQLNKQGLEAIRKRALTEGPSDWEKLALQKQKLEEGTALDNAAAQSRSGLSSSYSDMARRGGLSTGARERLARAGSRDLLQQRQQTARTGMGQRLDISTAGENQRLDLLKQLPGMEVQALQPEIQKTSMWQNMAQDEAARKQNLDLANRQYSTDVNKFNLANVMGEVGRQDAAKLAQYQEKMKAYIGDKQAEATKNSGGGKK